MNILKVNKIKNGEIFVFVSRNYISSTFTKTYIPIINEYKIFKIKDKLFLNKDIFHITGKKHSGLTEIESISTLISTPEETSIKIDNTISLYHPLIASSSSGLDIKIDNIIAIFEGDKTFLENFENNTNFLYI